MNCSTRGFVWVVVAGLIGLELISGVFVKTACSLPVMSKSAPMCRHLYGDPHGRLVGPVPSTVPSHPVLQQLRPNQVNVLLNLEQAAVTVLSKLPSGSTVKAVDFRQRFGADADDVMQGLEVIEVSKQGIHIDIERKRDTIDTLGNHTVIMSQHLSFDAIQRAKVIEVTNVLGIKVSIGAGLPDLQVKKVFMYKDAQGNTVMDLELEFAAYLPNISHTVVIDPSGQLLAD